MSEKVIICHDGTIIPWHSAHQFYKRGEWVFVAVGIDDEIRIAMGDNALDVVRQHTVDL